jgi:hypothetical protein
MSVIPNSMADTVKAASFPYAKVAYGLIGLLTLFRLWYCQTFELVADEAYYRLWSDHLDWSYFSKGPGVASVMALGRFIFGDTEWGIRVFAVLFSGGIGLLFFQLGKMVFSERVGFWAVVVAAGVPLFSVGSVLMTIDPISVFFWMAAACAFWKARNCPDLNWWIVTGFLVGLGMLGKYTNVAQLICFVFFCVWSRTHRSLLGTKRFWVMVLTALLCLAPVLFWNSRNDWITFDHLIHRGKLDESGWKLNPGELLEFLLMQAVVLSPFIAMGLLASLVMVWQNGKKRGLADGILYLVALFVPLIVFYTALSTKEAGEANWTVLSHVGGLVLMVGVWLRWADQSMVWRRLALVGLGLSFVVVVVLHVASVRPIGFKPIDKLFDRTRGAKDLALQVTELQKEHGASFLISNKYGYASLLSFYHPERPQTYLPNSEGVQNQFSFWRDYSEGFWAESALFVTDSEELPEQLKREFSEVRLIKEIWSHHGTRRIRRFYVYLCSEYGGMAESINIPVKQSPQRKKK